MDKIIYYIFPIIFMLHEFEEIIFLKIWLHRNKECLHRKFPKAGAKIYSQYGNFTTSGFTLAIAEEFILASIITYTAIIIQYPYLWFTVFIGFSVHIVVHIFQWILYRKYIPVIITSILVLPYCVYGFMEFIHSENVKIFWLTVSSIIGITAMFLNLILIHYFGNKFSNFENKILNK